MARLRVNHAVEAEAEKVRTLEIFLDCRLGVATSTGVYTSISRLLFLTFQVSE